MKRLATFLATLLVLAATLSTPDTMAYCTAEHVQTAYGKEALSSVTGDAQKQQVDTQRLQEAINEYGAYMEQHVRSQHPDNPFDESHEFLRGLNIEGAWLTLQKRTPGGASEDVRKDLKRLDGVLMKIATGKIDLMDQEEKDNAPSDRLNPDDLIQQRGTKDGDAFGLHRDLPDWLHS